jgi:hypothetical protein
VQVGPQHAAADPINDLKQMVVVVPVDPEENEASK